MVFGTQLCADEYQSYWYIYYVACHARPLPGDVMLTSLKSCRSPCMWHCHHAAERDAKSLSLQRCGHPIRHIWIRWTTASGVSFNRRSTVRGSMMCRSWKNVCWGSGCCWTTSSSWQWLCFPIRNGGLYSTKCFPKDRRRLWRRGNLPLGDLMGKEELAQGSSNGSRTIHDLVWPSVYGDVHNGRAYS